MMRYGSCLLIGAGILCHLAVICVAQEPLTEREKMLLQRIEQLEQRLEQVEKQLAERQPAASEELVGGDAQLEERVAALEEKYEPSRDSDILVPRWKDGLRFTSQDKAFDLRVGGRIQLDWIGADEDDEIRDALGEIDEGVEFRRARMFLSGTIYENVEYMAQYEFADDGSTDWKDVYLGVKNVGGGVGVRVGQFREPFSLEELTSSNSITFMERSLLNAFVPSRGTGLMAYAPILDERATWALGLFRDSDDLGERIGEDLGGEWNFTGRATALPWYGEDGANLLHLGLALSYRNPNTEELPGDDRVVTHAVRYRTRPEIHVGPRFADTGYLPADDLMLYGAEAAAVLGPFSLQSEFVYSDVNGMDTGLEYVDADPGFHGWYVEGSCFLTGEHRPYRAAEGIFGRVRPRRNAFDGEGGLGAWQVALRYSQIDLEDDPIDGGEIDDLTVGLNWHLNPNTRVMWNYVHSMPEWERKNLDADADIFMMRFQADF